MPVENQGQSSKLTFSLVVAPLSSGRSGTKSIAEAMEIEIESKQRLEQTSRQAPEAEPRAAESNLGGVDLWTAEPQARREAARRLGQVRSERKAAAVRENGKKGGRPPGSKTSEEAKAQMREAQRQRRARERAVQHGSES